MRTPQLLRRANVLDFGTTSARGAWLHQKFYQRFSRSGGAIIAVDASSSFGRRLAGREGRAYMMLVFFYNIGILFCLWRGQPLCHVWRREPCYLIAWALSAPTIPSPCGSDKPINACDETISSPPDLKTRWGRSPIKHGYQLWATSSCHVVSGPNKQCARKLSIFLS